MSVEFHGFPCRVKWQHKERRERSLEVCVDVHPLQVPRRMITSLHHLCNGRECWIRVGHTAPGIDGHCFVVYGHFFQTGIPYVGERRTLNEAFEAIVGVVKSVLDKIESPPNALKGLS